MTSTTTDTELTADDIAQAEQLAELLAARTAVEDANAKDLAKLGKSLNASRDAAVDAIAAAQHALVKMVETIDQHNANLVEASADLLARGLLATDETGTHNTGAAGRYEMRLNSEWWTAVNPSIMFHRTTNAALKAAFGKLLYRISSSTVSADFLARIPELPMPPVKPRVPWGVQAKNPSPVLADWQRAEEERIRKVEWSYFNPNALRR